MNQNKSEMPDEIFASTENEDPRMLREQIRVAEIAFNHLHDEHVKLIYEYDKVMHERNTLELSYKNESTKFQSETLVTSKLYQQIEQLRKERDELKEKFNALCADNLKWENESIDVGVFRKALQDIHALPISTNNEEKIHHIAMEALYWRANIAQGNEKTTNSDHRNQPNWDKDKLWGSGLL